MASYYFTVASLPQLTYDMSDPPDINTFLEKCNMRLKERDYRYVKNSCLFDFDTSGKDIHPIYSKWLEWEMSLRNLLVRERASELKIDPAKYLRRANSTAQLHEIVRGAAHAENPLAGEAVLNKARWLFLDELEAGRHFFDVEKIIIYYLRLQLIQRKVRFTTDRGKKNFDSNYNKIMENYSQDSVEIVNG